MSNWPAKCAGFVAVLLDHTRGCLWRLASICVADDFHILQASDVEQNESVFVRENLGGSRGHVWTDRSFLTSALNRLAQRQGITKSGVLTSFVNRFDRSKITTGLMPDSGQQRDATNRKPDVTGYVSIKL